MRIHSVLRTMLFAASFMILAGSGRLACLQQGADTTNASARADIPCSGDNCESAPLSDRSATQAQPKNKDTVAQETAPDSSMTFKKVFLNLPGDQKAIWTSPFRLRLRDSVWVAPLVGTTGVLIGSD